MPSDNQSPNKSEIFKKIITRLDRFEKILKLDKPLDLLFLLATTYISLWISARYHPDILNIILITAVVILARCFLVLVSELIGYYLYQKKLISHKKLSPIPEDLGIIIWLTAISLILNTIIIISYLQLNHIYIVLSVLLIHFVFLVTKKASFIKSGKSEKKLLSQKIITDFVSKLLFASIYSLASLFAFITIFDKATPLAWQLMIINIFLFLAYAIFSDSINNKVFINSIDTLMALICLLIYMVGILGIYLKILEINIILLLIISAGIYFFILYKLYNLFRIKDQIIAINYLKSIEIFMVFIPIIFWLVLIDW